MWLKRDAFFILVQKGAGPVTEGSDVEDEEDIDFDDEDFEGNYDSTKLLKMGGVMFKTHRNNDTRQTNNLHLWFYGR